jgi:hypothetical protein
MGGQSAAHGAAGQGEKAVADALGYASDRLHIARRGDIVQFDIFGHAPTTKIGGLHVH